MPSARTALIPARFCGPPGTANGGFSCGTFAAGIEGPAEVTLRRPVPLEEQILIEADEDGLIATAADGELIAEARPTRPLDGLRPPAHPSGAEAKTGSADSPFSGPRHAYPGCYVCGPDHPQGLHIHVGDLGDGSGAAAASFVIDPELAGADGNARAEIVWAALDCPSYVPSLWSDVPVLLGRLSAEQSRPVPVGEPLVAVSWPLGEERRKLHTASALLDSRGEELARARALWIRVPGADQRRGEH